MIASRLQLPLLHEQDFPSSSRGGITPSGSFASGRPGSSLSDKQRAVLHAVHFRTSYRKKLSDNRQAKPLTIGEYFCALAAVQGDIERALLQLNRRDFCLEIRYVCSPVSGIDVRAMVKKIGSGMERFLRQEKQTLDDDMFSRYAGRSGRNYTLPTIIN